MSNQNQKFALISVTDKSGIVEFAEFLEEQNYRIISTGGTGNVLEEGGIDVIPVGEWTGVSEMLDGRVKTLHPTIHAGILARRDETDQMDELDERGIRPIDMVVVNLYAFDEAVEEGKTEQELMENVDIGGPTMMRAAAKNYHSVAAVSSPEQYGRVKDKLEKNNGNLPLQFRKQLAETVFQRTASYDRAIARSFDDENEMISDQEEFSLEKTKELRYGENPHQEGGLYQASNRESGGFPGDARSIHGKELSYNNLMDMDAAYRLLADFEGTRPACTVIKHLIPCGAAISDTAEEAFEKAHAGDPVSAFGSIVGFNVPLTVDLAHELADDDYYIEGILAPDIEEGVVDVFKEGPGWGDRLRLVPTGDIQPGREAKRRTELRSLSGGVLLQQGDGDTWPDDVDAVSGEPDQEDLDELKFAWTVCKHVRSNAIVISKGTAVMGVGAGQPSRVDSAEIAVEKAGEEAEGAVMASDAFFPFPDALEVGIDAGVKAAVQPGGSVNDDAVIETARDRGITMVLTGRRHFRH